MPATDTSTDTSTDTRAKGPVVTKVGNLTADPELAFGASGKPYARLRLAVDTPKVPGDWAGERLTTYYDVTAFGSLAEHAAECLAKGARILVTGTGEVRTWTGEDGAEHRSKGILADALGPDLRWATATVSRASRSGHSAGLAVPADEEPF